MKRAAAIIGPTPPHVRWTLAHRCVLRARSRSPESVFHQLRSLQELTWARLDGRIHEGIAWSSECEATSHLRGFFTDEILAAYGGAGTVSAACQGCPANALEDRQGWAGCFGCLTANSGPADKGECWNALEQLSACQQEFNWLPLAEQGGLVTTPRWFGLWAQSPLPDAGRDLLDSLIARWQRQSSWPAPARRQWEHLAQALNLARRHDLAIMVSSVPAGYSDGVLWTVPAHCSACRAPRQKADRWCSCCSQVVAVIPERRRKVLGLRPYLDLVSILGTREAQDAYDRFQTARTMASS